MTLAQTLARALQSTEFEEDMADVPYAQHLGLKLRHSDNRLTIIMPFKFDLIGSPQRLHGGTIGAMLEIAGLVEAVAAQARQGEEAKRFGKPISITIDYLRGGEMKTTYAEAQVERMGRRVANIRSRAWQDDRENPIATAHMHVLLPQA